MSQIGESLSTLSSRAGGLDAARARSALAVGSSSPSAAHLAIDPALRALLHQCEAPVTARPIWWSAWSRAFGDRPLLIGLDERRAVAPLAVRSTRARDQIQILGGRQADRACLPASDVGSARELGDLIAERLAQSTRPWHLRLDHIPAQDPVAKRLAELLPVCDWQPRPELASPYVRLRPNTVAEDYLSRSARKHHRRTTRGFLHAGGSVRHLQDPDQIMAMLPQLARVRRARDHSCDRVSDLDTPRGYAFWASIISDHAAAGELEVALASVGGSLVAYDVVLLDGQADRLWDGRVAPEAESLSAGRLLQDVALTRAIDRGSIELDLMRGLTPAKLRLATDVRACSVLEAWSSRRQRSLALTARGVIDSAKEVRDSHPSLDRLWRATKQRTALRGKSSDRPANPA